jgi:hypothetical protein
MSKQFNIKGINGLYLSSKPELLLDDSNYKSLLIEDYDFFPETVAQSNLFNFKNSRYEDSGKILGSNSTQKGNTNLRYTEITFKNEIVSNSNYYNNFTLYFKFNGSTLDGYTLPGMSAFNTRKLLDRLQVEVYIKLGSKIIPLKINNPKKWGLGNSWVDITSYDKSDVIEDGGYGVEVTTTTSSITSSEIDCLHLAYTGNTTPFNGDPFYNNGDTLFNESSKRAPSGYNFKIDYTLPDFEQISGGGKDYSLIIRYTRVGDSKIEVMSKSHVYYTPQGVLFRRKLEKQAAFDFLIKKSDFYINTPGFSVTEVDKSFSKYNDGFFYILNKNNKPIYFNGLFVKNIQFRKENIFNNSDLRITSDNTVVSGNFTYENFLITFKNNTIGRLTISRLNNLINGNNIMLNPFQSLEFSATYLVLNLNQLDIHYYGKSNTNLNRKKGTIDITFDIKCFTDKEFTNQLNDTITLTINLVNTGYVPISTQQPYYGL